MQQVPARLPSQTQRRPRCSRACVGAHQRVHGGAVEGRAADGLRGERLRLPVELLVPARDQARPALPPLCTSLFHPCVSHHSHGAQLKHSASCVAWCAKNMRMLSYPRGKELRPTLTCGKVFVNRLMYSIGASAVCFCAHHSSPPLVILLHLFPLIPTAPSTWLMGHLWVVECSRFDQRCVRSIAPPAPGFCRRP